jgi:hypothetical protein
MPCTRAAPLAGNTHPGYGNTPAGAGRIRNAVRFTKLIGARVRGAICVSLASRPLAGAVPEGVLQP